MWNAAQNEVQIEKELVQTNKEGSTDEGTINSKINGTPKDFTSPFRSYTHFILAVPNLLAHNNITISYYGQVNSLLLKSSVASKWTTNHFWEYHLFCC